MTTDRKSATKIFNEVIITHTKWPLGALAVCAILGFASLVCAVPSLPGSIQWEYNRYNTSACQTCHEKIVDEYSQSFHAKSFSDPLFKGQYFKELLPRAEKDPELYQEAEACIACHAPIDFIVLNGRIFSEDQVNPEWSGVGCLFCHTIKGYDGETPGNGNYITEPNRGERVLGPINEKGSWHHVYSELHKKSEFCAICHNGFNRHGFEIKSTYTEWKNSIFAKKGIHCQDCHMNDNGFPTEGEPIYESGQALYGLTPERPTHRYPGAHSKTQILGTDIRLHMETETLIVSAGDEITIYIFIDNSNTGHKMPTGSADLRLLWLELEASNGDEIIPIPALSMAQWADRYDITGKRAFDQEILGEDIPKGTRIYRAILVDETGTETLSSYDAVRITFDNRLNPAELRQETYYFKVPQDVEGKIALRASLYYLPYPSSFAERFGLPKPESFEVTSTSIEIPLR